jgi:5-hydroxyisourate hydrolase
VTTLSTHVLDLERGQPAVGVPVTLFAGDRRLADAETNADGRIPDLPGGELSAGAYRLEFDLATYLERSGRRVPFLRRVTLEFELDAVQAHYHVPLLVSPYACTAYRGS